MFDWLCLREWCLLIWYVGYFGSVYSLGLWFDLGGCVLVSYLCLVLLFVIIVLIDFVVTFVCLDVCLLCLLGAYFVCLVCLRFVSMIWFGLLTFVC